MKLYADTPVRRTRQIVSDLLVVAWVVLWLQVSRAVRDATLLLAEPGEEISAAGSGLADRLRDAGRTVADVPLVGDQVSAPFQGAGDAADRIAAAGEAQVAAVTELAFWLWLAVCGIPTLLLLAVYLPLRWRFVREATASQQFIDDTDDLDLFALRALARQPMHRLAKVSRDPAGAWREGDARVIRALAELELRDSGLSARAVPSTGD